jgi:hypothetical protein
MLKKIKIYTPPLRSLFTGLHPHSITQDAIYTHSTQVEIYCTSRSDVFNPFVTCFEYLGMETAALQHEGG